MRGRGNLSSGDGVIRWRWCRLEPCTWKRFPSEPRRICKADVVAHSQDLILQIIVLYIIITAVLEIIHTCEVHRLRTFPWCTLSMVYTTCNKFEMRTATLVAFVTASDNPSTGTKNIKLSPTTSSTAGLCSPQPRTPSECIIIGKSLCSKPEEKGSYLEVVWSKESFFRPLCPLVQIFPVSSVIFKSGHHSESTRCNHRSPF